MVTARAARACRLNGVRRASVGPRPAGARVGGAICGVAAPAAGSLSYRQASSAGGEIWVAVVRRSNARRTFCSQIWDVALAPRTDTHYRVDKGPNAARKRARDTTSWLHSTTTHSARARAACVTMAGVAGAACVASRVRGIGVRGRGGRAGVQQRCASASAGRAGGTWSELYSLSPPPQVTK